MPTLNILNPRLIVTMNDAADELAGQSLHVVDGKVAQIAPAEQLPPADNSVNAAGKILLPGLVNTHHHLYQNLTRAVTGAQDALLFDWLKRLYPIWGRMRSDHIRVSTQIGLGELALSGCTTSSDHLYIYPNDCRLDAVA